MNVPEEKNAGGATSTTPQSEEKLDTVKSKDVKYLSRFKRPREFNMERVRQLTKHYDDIGEVYFTVVDVPQWHLIRQAYNPTGNSLIYPYEWSKRKAVEHFVNYYLQLDVEYNAKLTNRIREHLDVLERIDEHEK